MVLLNGLGFLVLGGLVVAWALGSPATFIGLLTLVGAAVSLLVGKPLIAAGFLILGGLTVSLDVGKPINRAHDGRALAAHFVVRFGAALFFGIATIRASRTAAQHGDVGWLLVPATLAMLGFASGAVLVWVALARSGASLCRVGLHRWTDIWSDAGPHQACARCGERATPKQRALRSAALLGALTFSLVTPAAALAVGVYVGTRLPPNYSLARSTACWRAHGYRVSPYHSPYDSTWEDRGFMTVEIRGHHDHQWPTFAPNQAVAWDAANAAGEGFYNPDYGPPPVPVRNVIFGAYGRFDDKPILACLRT